MSDYINHQPKVSPSFSRLRRGWLAVVLAAGLLNSSAIAGVPKELRTLQGHTGEVHALAIAPGGKVLASGSPDHNIKLWDIATGKELRTLQGHTDEVYTVVFAPDGTLLVSGGLDRTVRIWDLATGKERAVLKGHTGGVSAVALTADGKLLVSGSSDKTA